MPYVNVTALFDYCTCPAIHHKVCFGNYLAVKHHTLYFLLQHSMQIL